MTRTQVRRACYAASAWAVLAVVACGEVSDVPPPPATAKPADRPHAGAAPVRSDPSAVPRSTPTTSVDPVAELGAQVAQLRQEVDALRLHIARLPNGSQAAADATWLEARRDPLARAEADRAEAVRVAATEAAFRAEPRVLAWSEATAAGLRDALSLTSASLRSAARSVECRSSSCRIEIDDDAVPDLPAQLPRFVQHASALLPNVTAGEVDQGNGQTATVLYLSRELVGPPAALR